MEKRRQTKRKHIHPQGNIVKKQGQAKLIFFDKETTKLKHQW